jgi:hypothetical protein
MAAMPMQGQFYNPGMMMPMNNMGMNMMPMNNMGMNMMPMNNMGMPMNNMGMMYNNYNGFANPMYMQNNMVYNNMGFQMQNPNPTPIPTPIPAPNPNQNGEEKNGVLPRGNYVNGDINVTQGEDMINVTFDASTGVKTIVCVKRTTPFKEILKEYVKKIGLPENIIGSEAGIQFLFNGKRLDPNSEDTPLSLKLKNMTTVSVFDVGNVIGA